MYQILFILLVLLALFMYTYSVDDRDGGGNDGIHDDGGIGDDPLGVPGEFDDDDEVGEEFDDPPEEFDDPPEEFDDPPEEFDDPPEEFDDPPEEFDDPPEEFDDPPEEFDDPPEGFDDDDGVGEEFDDPAVGGVVKHGGSLENLPNYGVTVQCLPGTFSKTYAPSRSYYRYLGHLSRTNLLWYESGPDWANEEVYVDVDCTNAIYSGKVYRDR